AGGLEEPNRERVIVERGRGDAHERLRITRRDKIGEKPLPGPCATILVGDTLQCLDVVAEHRVRADVLELDPAKRLPSAKREDAQAVRQDELAIGPRRPLEVAEQGRELLV